MKRFIFCVSMILVSGWLLIPSKAIALEERLIAVVMANSQPRYQDIHITFVEQIKASCDGGCRIYLQTPNADIMSLRNSVRKAVALGADVIVTYGPAATLAAQAEAPSIPILFADVYDPVALSLVSEDRKTGRHMSGVRGDAPVQALFKYFVESTRAKSLAILFDTNSPVALLQKNILEESCNKRSVAVSLLPVDGPGDHLSSLKDLPVGIEGLFLANSEHPGSHLEQVLAFAENLQIPVLTQRDGAAELGAFMVLETNAEEQGLKLAEMAKKVLSGQKIVELPMYKPRQVSFVVNLKVAKKLNINVPFQTLSVASRVVR